MDHIIVLKDGSILEEGAHNDLTKKDRSLYAKLWDPQAGGFLHEENSSNEKTGKGDPAGFGFRATLRKLLEKCSWYGSVAPSYWREP